MNSCLSAAGPDVVLIETCRRFAAEELDRWYRYVMAPDDVADAQDTSPDLETLTWITGTAAATPEGWQAKALAYSAWHRNSFDDPQDERDTGTPLLAALLREMVGPTRDAIVARLAVQYGPLPDGYTVNGMWLGRRTPA